MSEHDAPDEVTKVARDLSEILDLAGALETQIVHKANDPLMPGGLSMVALAAVANLEAWQNVVDTDLRIAYENGVTAPELDDEDEWEPPLQTLCFWSEQWRVEHNRESDRRPTLASEANFIRQMLNWAWENEAHFEDFAGDIRRARVRLEEMLYAGNRAERSRVTCIDIDCERKPRLIKVYRDNAAHDHYKCPSCKTTYDHMRYRMAKANLLASQGADRHVPIQDAMAAIDRPERTFRKWLRFWYVRSYRDPLTGTVMCWWPDVREADLETPRRLKKGAAAA